MPQLLEFGCAGVLQVIYETGMSFRLFAYSGFVLFCLFR